MNPLHDTGGVKLSHSSFDPSIPRMFHPSMLPFILIRSPFAYPFFSQWCRLPPTLPFTFCFISLPSALPVVMTPSSRMMLEWSNCPRMPASLRKERRCFSEQPARNVFMATGSSRLLGSFRQPRHTSPKSPVGGDGQTGVTIPIDSLTPRGSGERRGQSLAGQTDDMD